MTTPARRQYLDIKAQHRDALLMYQVGDFFEFFDEDARVAARALQIALTSRSYGPDEQVPLAGVPLHALHAYAAKLVAQGFTVAICEQVEPPGRGLVRREVTRVLSPGTVVEPGMLPAMSDNYLVAVAWDHGRKKRRAGLACIEPSTGNFTCTQWEAHDLPNALRHELQRIGPAEILVIEQRDGSPAGDADEDGTAGFHLTPCPPHYFDPESSRLRLCRHFGVASLAAYGCASMPLAIAAAGAILAYLEHMNPPLVRLAVTLTTYNTAQYVEIDGRTWHALEALAPARTGDGGATLLGTIDATLTPMGTRLLRRTLLQPLKDCMLLESRLDAVAAFCTDAAVRQVLGDALHGLPDLERLAARVVQGNATPRELMALDAGLQCVAHVRAALADLSGTMLREVHQHLDPCREVTDLIERAVAPPDAADRRTLRRGYHAELDALEQSVSTSRRWIANLEARERERTGIKSLRVTYNKVFGYSIEVSRPNLARVPGDYERRQTLANGERFVTPTLKEHEVRVLQAEERIAALEDVLYKQLLEQLATSYARLCATAGALAQLDVWLSLATVAVARGYVRPVLSDDLALHIRTGRHPVIEAALDGHSFIPNDTTLGTGEGAGDTPEGRVLVLTGPNMAGKSTYLRQVAQIVLLAQIGSFVPADAARIGLVDRLFLRVGADDDLARGISTFMREMTETAYILHHATERSLVVLDEVGRGTSTRDGQAIARAVVEYLHDRVGCRTLFATHFHELADLADSRPHVRLAAMEVREADGQIVFLHRLIAGCAEQSYGLHVARMAGMPAPVTARAEALLNGAPDDAANEAGAIYQAPITCVAATRRHDDSMPCVREDSAIMGYAASAGAAREVVLGLACLNVAAMTPMEAINVLFSLQQRAAAILQTERM